MGFHLPVLCSLSSAWCSLPVGCFIVKHLSWQTAKQTHPTCLDWTFASFLSTLDFKQALDSQLLIPCGTIVKETRHQRTIRAYRRTFPALTYPCFDENSNGANNDIPSYHCRIGESACFQLPSTIFVGEGRVRRGTYGNKARTANSTHVVLG